MGSNDDLLNRFARAEANPPPAPRPQSPPAPPVPETLFRSPLPGEKIPITISDGVYIPLAKIPMRDPSALVLTLKQQATFRNPAHAMAQKLGRPVPSPFFDAWYITDDPEENTLVLPKGDLRGILDVFHRMRLPVDFIDRTAAPEIRAFSMKAPLDNPSSAVASALSGKRFGILSGGQGVDEDKRIAAHLIYFRRVRTLVVVKRRWQLHLWKKILLETTTLADADIGLVGDGRKDIDAPVVVGIDRSLYQFVPGLRDRVGFLIVDTCDIVNVKIFFRLVWRLNARFLLGIATQPSRRDGLTEMMRLFLGRTSAVVPVPEGGESSPVVVVAHQTGIVPAGASYDDILGDLCGNAARTRKIFGDILSLLGESRKVVVTGPRIRQLQDLQALLMKNYRAAEVITGQSSDKEVIAACQGFESGDVQVVLCPFKSIGGVPLSPADAVVVAGPYTLFETAVHLSKRLGPGGVILEYVDAHEHLVGSFRSRVGFYRKLKFAIKSGDTI